MRSRCKVFHASFTLSRSKWFVGWLLCGLIACWGSNIYGQSTESGTASSGSGLLPVISDAGRVLSQFLDGMDVEHHWLRSSERVRWATGDYMTKPDGEVYPPLAKDETHCSAFVAAAAARLGIYILHPPEHSHVLLANAQYDWLLSDAGKAGGWTELEGPRAAQEQANQGRFVVVSFKNADTTLPGHTAVVRPDNKRPELIDKEGPQVTQAGVENSSSLSLQQGFQHHPGAWPPTANSGVRFFAHVIDPQRLKEAARVHP